MFNKTLTKKLQDLEDRLAKQELIVLGLLQNTKATVRTDKYKNYRDENGLYTTREKAELSKKVGRTEI